MHCLGDAARSCRLSCPVHRAEIGGVFLRETSRLPVSRMPVESHARVHRAFRGRGDWNESIEEVLGAGLAAGPTDEGVGRGLLERMLFQNIDPDACGSHGQKMNPARGK